MRLIGPSSCVCCACKQILAHVLHGVLREDDADKIGLVSRYGTLRHAPRRNVLGTVGEAIAADVMFSLLLRTAAAMLLV